MDTIRLQQAMARIDAAAGRIAAAAPQHAGGDPDLQAKYDRLRQDAGATLTQLDTLIAELEEFPQADAPRDRSSQQ